MKTLRFTCQVAFYYSCITPENSIFIAGKNIHHLKPVTRRADRKVNHVCFKHATRGITRALIDTAVSWSLAHDSPKKSMKRQHYALFSSCPSLSFSVFIISIQRKSSAICELVNQQLLFCEPSLSIYPILLLYTAVNQSALCTIMTLHWQDFKCSEKNVAAFFSNIDSTEGDAAVLM